MSKLLMLKGLPASGKSTYAKELLKTNQENKWKRINKDDLRGMIDNGVHSRAREGTIMKCRDELAHIFLDDGFSVVIDDTNLNHIHEETLRGIADAHDAEFEIKYFDTPVYECIERDAKREKPVGADTILDMYFRWVEKKKQYDPEKGVCYIFDIDGTLARMNGRGPYEYEKADTDIVAKDVRDINQILGLGAKIFIVSGREDSSKEKTIEWLDKHFVKYDFIHMRKEGDHRKDSIIKEEIYKEHIEPYYNVLGVFDDRNQVVDMWRLQGLTCFQVNYGNF